MKKLFRNRNLFQQFAISFIITIFLPISVIGGISYYRGTYQIRNMVRELLEQIVMNINSQFDNLVNENERFTLQMANNSDVQQFIENNSDNYYGKYQLLKWSEKQTIVDDMFIRYPIISRVSIVGDSGIEYTMFNNSSGDANPKIYEHQEIVKRSEYYKTSLPQDGSMGVVVDKLIAGEEPLQSDSANYITFARRIFSKVPFVTKGTVFVDINVNSLEKMWGKKDLKNGFIWIIDNKGKIIYYPDQSKVGLMAGNFLNTDLLKSDIGNFTMNWENKSQFFVYNTSAVSGWKIIATIPVDNLNLPVKDLGTVILFTLLCALPLTLLVGYFFIRSILKPIRKLERAMKEIGNENWEKIDGEIPHNEIGNLMLNYNRMSQKISDLIEKVYKSELEQSEIQLQKQKAEFARQKAEFQALQTQINPHFLYNTLSAINTYALMVEETTIPEMVDALSMMLRYAVQNPFEPVKLKDEVEHVKNFLTIQKHRNRRMPFVEWNIEDCLELPVLRLTLQPLVENVFQHAFPDSIQSGHYIMITARREEKFFVLEVMDNGCGIDCIGQDEFLTPNNCNIKFGIGIMNVHRRIQIAYGNEFGLLIGNNPNGGTIVKMLLPLNNATLELDKMTKTNI
jgi:Predicted signal transduction protein with a C-terminal ATPase domain